MSLSRPIRGPLWGPLRVLYGRYLPRIVMVAPIIYRNPAFYCIGTSDPLGKQRPMQFFRATTPVCSSCRCYGFRALGFRCFEFSSLGVLGFLRGFPGLGVRGRRFRVQGVVGHASASVRHQILSLPGEGESSYCVVPRDSNELDDNCFEYACSAYSRFEAMPRVIPKQVQAS